MTDQPDYAGVPVPPESFLSEIRQGGNRTLTEDFIACAEWGANEQLNRCVAYLKHFFARDTGEGLIVDDTAAALFLSDAADCMRQAMRPPTGSLKQQAVSELLDIMQLAKNHGFTLYAKTIRRALEALPDD
jgi:hypothetical protein